MCNTAVLKRIFTDLSCRAASCLRCCCSRQVCSKKIFTHLMRFIPLCIYMHDYHHVYKVNLFVRVRACVRALFATACQLYIFFIAIWCISRLSAVFVCSTNSSGMYVANVRTRASSPP